MQGQIKEIKRDDSKDYLRILEALREIPFLVGRNLLIDFLLGKKNKSIIKNELYMLKNHAILKNLDYDRVNAFVDNLISNKMIEIVAGRKNQFLKLLMLTDLGKNEIRNPSLFLKKVKDSYADKNTIISEKDRQIFKELDGFLGRYNDEQKKAIISEKEKILCIAGAGSGKTTVLTKRIEFLVKYKSVNAEKILAITFTRKARQEMSDRLLRNGVNCKVETFNSFCEKILQKYGGKIYGRQMNVLNYGNKIMAIMSALGSIGMNMNQAIDIYFSEMQKRNRTKEQLYNIFMNDCFFILDYFKSKNTEMHDFSKDAGKEKDTAKLIFKVCSYLKEYMKMHGFRDYNDQLLDCLKFFKENKEFIPEYDYILVDEYQDVNSSQIELLDLLNAKNLFCVGDPRQSIFGWRGSDIKYILKFEEKYPDCEVIILRKNYRSTKHIVNLINYSIKEMKFPDLENHFNGENQIKLFNFDSEDRETEFVISEILSSKIEREEIFVLARTNRQIVELSKKMKEKSIPHVLKTDEINHMVFSKKGEVTLATIHAIKGLEAKMVFVIGCNELNFPCKASDHPVIELVKINEYDKEEEEKRLFYVALSRAKQKLILTYSGKKPTYFINDEMKKVIDG